MDLTPWYPPVQIAETKECQLETAIPIDEWFIAIPFGKVT